jgi:tetratricopeptide (TPR) repeat protein/transglutaminase-like putative cysteine protease
MSYSVGERKAGLTGRRIAKAQGMPTLPALVSIAILLGGCGSPAGSKAPGPDQLRRLTGVWKKHRAEWRRAVGKDARNPHMVFLRRDYRLELDDEGRARWSFRRIYQPLTKKGASYSDMAYAYWSPWYEKRPIIKGLVVDPNGKTLRFDPKVVEEGSASTKHKMLTSRRRLRAPLPGVVAGSVVYTEIVEEQHRAVNRGGDVHMTTLTPTVPTLDTRVTITAPSSAYLAHAVKGLDIEPVTDTVEDGRRKIVYELGARYERLVDEPHLPPETLATPVLVVSTARTWAEAAETARKRLEEKVRPDQVRPIVEKLLRREAGGNPDTLSTTRLIGLFTRYIHQKVRYTSVSLGAGAVEPSVPKVTLERTFGDCKDMTVLLLSMLRAAGRAAYPALVKAGTGTDVWPDMPGVSAFNHVIVRVTGESPLWVDPTARWTPPGRLPLPCSRRWALVLKPNVKGLTRTPGMVPSENQCTETRTIVLAQREGGAVTEITRCLGTLAASMRRTAAFNEKKAYRKHMERYVKSSYGAEELASFSHSDPDDLSKPFTMKIKATEVRKAWTDSTHSAVKIDLRPLFVHLPSFLTSVPEEESKHWKRKHALWLRQPYSLRLHYTITPPTAYEIEKHPGTESIEMGPARLSWKTSVDEESGMATVDLRFTTTKRLYEASEVKQLWRALESLQREHPTMIVLYKHKAKKLVSEGKVRAALDYYRKLMKGHPRKPIHRSRLAEQLVTLGFVREAVALARENVKLFPKDDDAWHTLAWALEHNDWGERWGDGYRRAEAVAAYRKAVSVDPEANGARKDFINLLLKNSIGLPNYDAKDLDSAVGHIVRLRKKHEHTGHDMALIQTLFRRRRFGDLQTWAKRMKPTKKLLAFRVAAEALSKGTEAAFALSRRLAKDLMASREITAEGATIMLKERYYRAARNLLRPIARPVGMTRQLSIWKKLERFIPSKEASKKPDELARNQIYYMFTGTWTDERARRALAPATPGIMREAFHRFYLSMKKGMELQAPKHGFSQTALADLMLSTLKIKSEGSSRKGWLVRAFSFGSSLATFYMVETPSGPRLRSLSSLPGENGKLIDTYLAKGNRGAAELLLDWMAKNEDSSSDPFAGSAFSHIWTSSAGRDALTMKLAAAALMAKAQNRAPLAIRRLKKLERRIKAPHLRLQLRRALAAAYKTLDKHKRAAKLYEKLHSTAPRAIGPFVDLCSCLVALDKHQAAIRLAKERLRKKPNDLQAYFIWTTTLGDEKKMPEALEVANRWISKGSPNPFAYLMRAWVHVQLGEKHYEKALADAEKAKSMSPSQSIFGTVIGLIHVKMGRLDRAYSTFRQLVQNREANVPSSDDFYLRGKIAEAAGLTETAIRCMKRVKRSDLTQKSSYYQEAQKTLKRLQNSEKANPNEKGEPQSSSPGGG